MSPAIYCIAQSVRTPPPPNNSNYVVGSLLYNTCRTQLLLRFSNFLRRLEMYQALGEDFFLGNKDRHERWHNQFSCSRQNIPHNIR